MMNFMSEYSFSELFSNSFEEKVIIFLDNYTTLMNDLDCLVIQSLNSVLQSNKSRQKSVEYI